MKCKPLRSIFSLWHQSRSIFSTFGSKIFCLRPLQKDFALKFGLYVIEDCAEAIGSVFKDKPVGVFGDVATFSFFGNKTISTGEGGMVLFKDKDFASKCRVKKDTEVMLIYNENLSVSPITTHINLKNVSKNIF